MNQVMSTRARYAQLKREKRQAKHAGMTCLAIIILGALGIMLLCSCTIAHHPTAGTYATLGGDTTGLVMNGTGINMTSNNNSEALKDASTKAAKVATTRIIAPLVSDGVSSLTNLGNNAINKFSE